MKYLLDTNTCIFIIKNRPKQVRVRFEKMDAEDVAISSITEAELLYGAYKSERVKYNTDAIILK